MLKVDTFRMHDQHRKANLEHDQWLADIDFWREEHSRAAGMLEAVKEAWDKAGSALDAHAQQIQRLQDHLRRHEQMFSDEGWAAELFEDESIVAEHREFQVAQAAAVQAHEKLSRQYVGVMAEVLELLKLTHPNAVVQETGQ